MKKIFKVIITLLSLQIFSCNGRYEYEIFSNVNKAVNYSDVYNDLEHEMDIYTPQRDIETTLDYLRMEVLFI